MGNSPISQKYTKTFNKEDLNDKSKFNRDELSAELYVPKGGSNIQVIDKGIEIVKEKANMTLKINNPNDIILHDKNLDVNYNLTHTYQYPLDKYCVTIDNKKKYCSCDLSIIDLSMDITELKSKL